MTSSIAARETTSAPKTYPTLVKHLAQMSVKKHFDAYADIDWDSPEMAISVDDERFERPVEDALGATGWYRSQPAATRARIGLELIVHQMRVGIAFENFLQRGLLEMA